MSEALPMESMSNHTVV